MTVNQKIKKLTNVWEWRFGKRTTMMHHASDYSLWRGCVNKIRYETFKDARDANRAFYVYHCDYCGGYHHTKVWPGRKRKVP